MHRCTSRRQAGILVGFETIAHQRLRPNEWPKIPIAAGSKYLKMRPKQGSCVNRATKNMQRKALCSNDESLSESRTNSTPIPETS
jgi:hypothetical protein